MRRRAVPDANQAAIVAVLETAGCFVFSLHTVGGGCPDLLVSRAGTWFVLEIKNLSGHRRRLTPDQVAWHKAARGPVHVVCSIREALDAVGLRAVAAA